MTSSLNSLSNAASAITGAGTLLAMDKACSPKGILQHIINFFTFGGVRRDNEKQYDALVKFMADELYEATGNGKNTLPEHIIMKNFNGHKVEFSLPGDNNPDQSVIITVTKGHKSESAHVNLTYFYRACNTLIFRHKYGIPQNNMVLTEHGKMNLKDVDLSGAEIETEDLSYADLSNARMDNSTCFYNTNLSFADLTGANLSEVSMKYVDLSNACLENAILSDSKFYKCILSETSLKNSNLARTSIIKCKLTQAKMEQTILSGCYIANSVLDDCNLNHASLSGSRLYNVEFIGADLRYSELNHSVLHNIDFTLADLTGAQLAECRPTKINIDETIMSDEGYLQLADGIQLFAGTTPTKSNPSIPIQDEEILPLAGITRSKSSPSILIQDDKQLSQNSTTQSRFTLTNSLLAELDELSEDESLLSESLQWELDESSEDESTRSEYFQWELSKLSNANATLSESFQWLSNANAALSESFQVGSEESSKDESLLDKLNKTNWSDSALAQVALDGLNADESDGTKPLLGTE